jgi:hypothetical protein
VSCVAGSCGGTTVDAGTDSGASDAAGD